VDAAAKALEDWHASGQRGPRPSGHLRPHTTTDVTGVSRLWASLLLRQIVDPDGRALRDRLRDRP
jgi:hypothetical protein